MRNIYIFLLAVTCPLICIGQDINYAREVVDKLTSNEFKGRGYVENGDKIAAEYIKGEFEKIGIKKFNKSYFQKFETSVNSFPGKMKFEINGKTLRPGIDYLIEPGSPKIDGEFEVVNLNMEDLLDLDKFSETLRRAKGKFITIPRYDNSKYSQEENKQISDIINFLKFHPDNPASGSIIFSNDKLTWSPSTILNSKPSFTVVDSLTNGQTTKVTLDVENKFISNYKSQNVIGFIEGQNTDSLVVLVAHYDHLGMMGSETIFPGANDNASGIAILLNLAKDIRNNKPKYTTVFIAFGGEELGLLGAKEFTTNPYFELSKIKFLLNFDISGTGDDGIQVVNGKIYRDKFNILKSINTEQDLLKQVKIRGEACNSDHCMFHNKGVPCFFIYTLGGIQAYHDVFDKSETLPLTEFEDYFKLISQFILTI
jgi:aminopeptidase YwaD